MNNCPNCNNWLNEGEELCPNCGSTIYNKPPQNQKPNSPYKHKMVFNIILAIWMMVTYAPSSSSGLAIFQCESIAEFIGVIIALAICAFIMITGFLLIKRHKLGFIFQYIVNSCGLLCWGGIFLLALLAIIGTSGASGAEIDVAMNTIIDIFAVVFAIFSLPPIALHTTGLIYYTVNRKKYFEKNDDNITTFNN